MTQLIDTRDQRLCEPLDSPYRMEDACRCLPESLDGLDLDTVGCHRGCYQAFTKNKDRLQSNTIMTSKSYSPRKRSPSATILFPPECIFCQKLQIKISWKTERCMKFPVYKDKQPTWKQIESRSVEMDDTRLLRMVQGQDLFAKEAQYPNHVASLST